MCDQAAGELSRRLLFFGGSASQGRGNDMLIRFRQHQGQTIIGQYALVFFVAIATITAMTIYVRRGIQARIYDAETYALKAIKTGANVSVLAQYEPYYTNRTSDKKADQKDETGFTRGRYSLSSSQNTVVNGKSKQ